ncbi:MAG: class I SAM-dependent methyltransferase [Pseudomonadales bacterium]
MDFVFSASEYAEMSTGTFDRTFWQKLASEAETVLEVGCGTGRVARWLIDDHDYYCVDTAMDMVEYVRDHLGLGEKARVGRIEDLVWAVQFDLVIAPANVVCHIEPEALPPFFQAAHRVLALGGRLVVDTFNPNPVVQPRGEYVFREYVDPRDSMPVTVRCRPELHDDVQILHLAFYKGGRLQRETELVQHMHSCPLVEEAARNTGYVLVDRFGDYDFSPWTTGSRKQIHVFQKQVGVT